MIQVSFLVSFVNAHFPGIGGDGTGLGVVVVGPTVVVVAGVVVVVVVGEAVEVVGRTVEVVGRAVEVDEVVGKSVIVDVDIDCVIGTIVVTFNPFSEVSVENLSIAYILLIN